MTNSKQTEALREALTSVPDWASEAKEQPAQQQEPVAWRTFDGEGGYEYRSYEMNEQYAQEWEQRNPKHKGWVEPLYTTPPAQRKPLTDEEIEKLREKTFSTGNPYCPVDSKSMRKAARAIEAAHGIKEKNT